MVTEFGKEEQRNVDLILPEDTVIASVLLLLSLNIFTVIQVSLSSLHSGNWHRG